MLDVLVTQHSRWTARRVHRALFGQTLIDFGGDSWTCLSTECTKSKISNRCQHRQQSSQNHILSNFTRKFSSSTNCNALPVATSIAEEGSVCSDSDFSEDSSDFDCTSACSRRGDSASHSHDISAQPIVERPTQALEAAQEDLEQASLKTSDFVAHSATEFFELTPGIPG